MAQNPVLTSHPLAWASSLWASFSANRGLMLAASLSFTTVLSLVPFLAVAFSVAKGLGVYEAPFLREALMRLTAEKDDVVDAILEYIGNTNVKALGIIGLASLFLTSVGMIGAMESALNAVWGVVDRRTGWNRISNFVTVIVVCPVFILAAFSATASLHHERVADWLSQFDLANQTYVHGVKVLPVAMLWAALFVVYKYLPNARVRNMPALVGSLLAALLWQAAQAGYIRYQVGATGYNAIYGSFAQLPLLLLWLYLSWVVVLAGAVVVRAIQTREPAGAGDAGVYSVADRRDMALLLALMLTERAEDRRGPLDAVDAALALGVPQELVEDELTNLARMGVAVQAAHQADTVCFVLAAAPDKITASELLLGWENLRGDGQAVELSHAFPMLAALRDAKAQAVRQSASQTLRDMWANLPVRQQDASAGEDTEGDRPEAGNRDAAPALKQKG